MQPESQINIQSQGRGRKKRENTMFSANRVVTHFFFSFENPALRHRNSRADELDVVQASGNNGEIIKGLPVGPSISPSVRI